jgi:membrane protease YdiL (CAAX protease family)
VKTNTSYQPTAYFAIVLLITSCSWFVAARISCLPDQQDLQLLCMLPGFFAPCLTALFMVYRSNNTALRRDYWQRLTSLRRINLATLPMVLFLMPAVMLASIAVSLLFGKSAEQFALVQQFSFSIGPVPVLLILILVPALEEMGWRGYGVDSLRSRGNLFVTSLWFGLLWALWHLPLAFIQHSYQHELLTNWVYAANFWISLFPAAFIINWLYYRNNRSIIACFLFHASVDIASEMFRVEQFTKCIGTGFLLLIAAVLVVLDRRRFFAPVRSTP